MKRVFDILFVLAVSPIVIPVVLALMVVVRVRMGSPVFFIQLRPGLRGKPFRMVKFRTMTDARDAQGALLPDSERTSRLGHFLRITSLDELPELWNVLKGEMSLVGPRPLLMDYLPLYSAEQARRHEVRPGITGWAQVRGRNAISWEEKFAFDVWYVDNHSFWMDARILIRTVASVFGRRGITPDGLDKMPRFKGSETSC